MQVLEKALTAELEGLQKIHVAVAKQITRLQVVQRTAMYTASYRTLYSLTR